MKEHWADELLRWKLVLGDHYPSRRARIALIIAGLIPSGTVNGDKKLVKEELARIKSNMGHPVNRDNIVSAFEQGEEVRPAPFLRSSLMRRRTLRTSAKTSS